MVKPKDGASRKWTIEELATVVVKLVHNYQDMDNKFDDCINTIEVVGEMLAVHNAYLEANAEPQELKIAKNKVKMAVDILGEPCPCADCVAKREAS